jgi:hypothetical protein
MGAALQIMNAIGCVMFWLGKEQTKLQNVLPAENVGSAEVQSEVENVF